MATQVKTNGYNGMMLDAYKNAAETATYIDSRGKRQKGTVAESPAAASTETIGGLTGKESIAELYKKAYEQQVSAANEKTEAQIAELQRKAEEQKTLAAEDYRKANEQLYIDYMKGEKTLPERLAAMGITGGAAETSEIALRNGYSGNLSENERARLLGERSIDSEVAAARIQAQLAAKDAESEALIQYFSNLIAQKQQEEAERKANQQMRAELMAEAGDFSGLVSMGIISGREAQTLQQSWIAQNPDLAEAMGYVEKKKSSGSGYTPPKPATTEEGMQYLKDYAKLFSTKEGVDNFMEIAAKNAANGTTDKYNAADVAAVKAALQKSLG